MKAATGKIAAAFLALCAAGCASITYTTPEMLDGVSVKGLGECKNAQTVLIDTTGFYFMWLATLVSGDVRWNEEKKSIEGGTKFFSDQVGINELKDALVKLAESRNCDLAEVYAHDADSFYAELSDPIAGLFGSSHMSISAILVPRSTPAEEVKE